MVVVGTVVVLGTVVVVVVLGGTVVALLVGDAELGGAEELGVGSATGDDEDAGTVVDGGEVAVDPSDGVVVLPGASEGDVAVVSEGDVVDVSEDSVVDDSEDSDVEDSEVVVASTSGTGSQVNGDDGRTGNGSPGGKVAAGSCSTTLYVKAFHCSTSCCFCSTWPTSCTVVLTATSLFWASSHWPSSISCCTC